MTIDDLTWMPAWRIRELILARDVSCVEVTEHFLGRIQELNKAVRAMENVDADGARRQAVNADRRLAEGEEAGPVLGIPVAVKANMRVEGLPHGILRSGRPPESASRFDDIIVERLRTAGAIIVGTNTMMGTGGGGIPDPERPGVFRPFNWDAEARNPWDASRVPGWSSSGGAAAAAARLLPVTIGNDGGGSTRLPAAYSGVVGLHTTRGLIPYVDYEKPAMMLTASNGPLARDVRDVALVTRAISGPDGRDYVCLQDETPDCVLAPHHDLQLARLPRRLSAVRIHRRSPGGPPDRQLARPRGLGPAGGRGISAEHSPPRPAADQLTLAHSPGQERVDCAIHHARAWSIAQSVKSETATVHNA
jgi:Asp-tRNA(Asn)/Glu-tRNA(Gln) amidotransferase A subunit family amidase